MHLRVINPSSLAAITSGVLLGILILLTATHASESVPFSTGRKSYLSGMEEPDTEMMLEMLTRLGESIIRANDLENSKRGLDLGLSRGFSGSQAAKHLMGLAAANYAGGPGRRRRASSRLLPNEI